MTAPEDPLLVRIVLGLYPARWRERYGEEFAALLSDMTADASRLARICFIWSITSEILSESRLAGQMGSLAGQMGSGVTWCSPGI